MEGGVFGKFGNVWDSGLTVRDSSLRAESFTAKALGVKSRVWNVALGTQDW